MARQHGRLGAQVSAGLAGAGRAGAGRWGETCARGALRHGRIACDTRGARRAGAWGKALAARQAGARAGRCDTAVGAAIRQGASATTRPGLPTIRSGVRAPGRARAWECLLGPLGACASCLVFRIGFRLGDIFESPFGPGS